MSAWIFTTEAPLYLPPCMQRVLAVHGDAVDRVILAGQPLGRFLRQQYRLFGPVDGLRMGSRYLRGRLLSTLPPARQRSTTGTVHSVRDAAALHGVPVERVSDISDPEFVDRVRRAEPELLLSIWCGQLFGPELLDVPEWPINFHPSLLPDYRGPTPEFWALYHGDDRTGWTAHVMTEEFDEGPIIEQRGIEIGDESLHELTQRLMDVGAEFVVDVLDRFPDAEFETRPNPATDDDYCPAPTAAQRREFKRRGNRLL
ncbi:MAG: formyltransferase family protein [Haloferacaceae archaeon]